MTQEEKRESDTNFKKIFRFLSFFLLPSENVMYEYIFIVDAIKLMFFDYSKGYDTCTLQMAASFHLL